MMLPTKKMDDTCGACGDDTYSRKVEFCDLTPTPTPTRSVPYVIKVNWNDRPNRPGLRGLRTAHQRWSWSITRNARLRATGGFSGLTVTKNGRGTAPFRWVAVRLAERAARADARRDRPVVVTAMTLRKLWVREKVTALIACYGRTVKKLRVKRWERRRKQEMLYGIEVSED